MSLLCVKCIPVHNITGRFHDVAKIHRIFIVLFIWTLIAVTYRKNHQRVEIAEDQTLKRNVFAAMVKKRFIALTKNRGVQPKSLIANLRRLPRHLSNEPQPRCCKVMAFGFGLLLSHRRCSWRKTLRWNRLLRAESCGLWSGSAIWA